MRERATYEFHKLIVYELIRITHADDFCQNYIEELKE